ncbi:NAD(P)-dependent oxidoreductase [Amycolatopsis magusensis]|uniref:NAD(P)-dependent oxidoreductase n=1 Tax=Amycolatopsis magusensis TaxID=882444 RepID=UPI0024A8E157|nr:NAD(P)-binding domain-containing protein [Amycolatopsis magusensis]MDI5975138.1 NAD(P)-binding domain-containing protein [Amycolatopsis magusensis]
MTTKNSTHPVTVLGLGLMGRALAGAFLRDGHPTTVWNRTAAKADDLVAEGATLAGSLQDALTANPLIVVCVSDYEAFHGLLDPHGALLEGRVLVNLTSGTSEQARETAAWAAGLGATYLDGVILAVPQAIATPDAILLHSGPAEAFEQYEPVLRSLGPTTHLGTDHGLSALHDIAVLGLMWSVLNGFLQGAALLGSAGVPASAFADLTTRMAATVADWTPGYAKQIDEGAYPAYDSTIDTHLAAMDHLVHESEAAGINTELPKSVKAFADRAIAAGRGGDGYAAMIEVFRTPSEVGA